jgi:hypothetical protein
MVCSGAHLCLNGMHCLKSVLNEFYVNLLLVLLLLLYCLVLNFLCTLLPSLLVFTLYLAFGRLIEEVKK